MYLYAALILLTLISVILWKSKKIIALLSVLILFFIFVCGFEELIPSGIAEDKDPAQYLRSFYSNESERVIMFKKSAPESPPFDIVILHICSLSWDDLKEIGMSQDDPFFKQFDYLFANFNSATGYSGPAVIRLLHSNCGQKSMEKMMPDKTCLLMDTLSSVGYETYIGMNHDGRYGDFINNIKKNVLTNAKWVTHEGLSPAAMFFDDKTPLYSDFTVLKRWFDTRSASSSKETAFYYNTASLHAGSHWVGEKHWATRDTHDQYKEILSVLLKDVNKFIGLLKSSKRNTVLIFVPEHGRALNGTPFQIADLRDIPLPKITKVPVGIKLIGPKFNEANIKQHIISKPASYLAISWVLSDFIKNNPFGAASESPDDIAFKIPKTDFVSEHDGRIIVDMDGSYLYYGKDKKWITLSPSQLK